MREIPVCDIFPTIGSLITAEVAPFSGAQVYHDCFLAPPSSTAAPLCPAPHIYLPHTSLLARPGPITNTNTGLCSVTVRGLGSTGPSV